MRARSKSDPSYVPVPGLGFIPGSNIVAIRLNAALHPRRYSPPVSLSGPTRLCILLADGAATVHGIAPIVQLAAPTLAWVPSEPGRYLRVEPGAQGYLIWVLDAFAKEALGQDAESAHLRQVLDRTMVAREFEANELVPDLEHAFVAIDRETRRTANGAQLYLRALLAVIIVQAWRACGLEEVAAKGYGTDSTLLLRFRHLVELHFREHWTIANYARLMGLSHDRLHDTCVRALRRTPLQLLHERLTREASQRLLRSGFTIEHIAWDLGFRTTSYFNKFFRRNAGISPGRYRRQSLGTPTKSDGGIQGGFADWP